MDSTLRFGSPLVGFKIYMFHVSAGGDGWSRGRNNRCSTSRVSYDILVDCFLQYNLHFISPLENVAGGIDGLHLHLSYVVYVGANDQWN